MRFFEGGEKLDKKLDKKLPDKMPSFFVWFLGFLGARGKPSRRERLRFLLPLLERVGGMWVWEWLDRLIILKTAFCAC
jgi:hypothetical protein